MEAATLRLKLRVESVKRVADSYGSITGEEIQLCAVYDSTPGSANSKWCKWTPCGNFQFTVNNPTALGKVLPGQFYFVDLIPTDKDSL